MQGCVGIKGGRSREHMGCSATLKGAMVSSASFSRLGFLS